MTSDHVQQRIVLLLSDAHQAARTGDWLAVRQKTEQVLHLNPFNHDARAYWALAKNGGIDPNDTVDTRIAGHLDLARVALEAGDWERVGNECRIVLELDDTNAEAEGYLRAAEETIQRDSKKTGRRKPARTSIGPAVVRSDSPYAFTENRAVARSARSSFQLCWTVVRSEL